MSRRPIIPFRITLLLILVLIPTVLNAVRFFTAIAWTVLRKYEPGLLVDYVAITGAIWTLAGGFVLWSFFRQARRSGFVILGAAGAYALWVWADRLLVQPGTQADWPFDLIVTIVLLAYVAVVVLDPHNRPYFRRETHER